MEIVRIESLPEVRQSLNIENQSYFHNPGTRPLDMLNVGQALDKAANLWPDRPFFISEFESAMITFGEMANEANKLAQGLIALGMKPGDRLGICSPNSIRWFALMMAASKIGVLSVAINPANQIRELEFCLNKVGVKAFAAPSSFRVQNYYSMLDQLMPEMKHSGVGKIKSSKIPSLETVIMMDDINLDGAIAYKDILNISRDSTMLNIQSSIAPDSTFSILFTSGSTGLPKAAMQSHISYLNNSKNVGYRCKLDQGYHKICLQVPLFHALGLLIAMAGLQHGSSIILPSPSFNPETALKTIVKNGCTVLSGTPTMYVDMIKHQNEAKYLLNTPEIAVTGGAPCSPQLFNKMTKYLNVSSVKSIYGMTEACSVLQSMPDEDFYKATETVGKVMDHLEIKVVDKDGFIVPIGTPGELCIRGYSNMIGYWDDVKKTSEAISPENWMKTGDQFIMEKDGYAKISGRLKDVIIRGGENIFPKEIEDFLNTHPDVIETQVFGIKDDRLGEEICASVRIKDGAKFDYTVLKLFCKGAIAHFKVPKYLKIVDDFPKTASGKIQKFKLRELVENGHL